MTTCRMLQFQVADLPEAGVEVAGEVPLAAMGIEEDERVRCPAPLSFRLRLAPVQDGILVTGEVRTELLMECDRCLAPVRVPVADPDVCHHLEHVEALIVDLTEDLREDILLAFPQTCLCQDECCGLCPDCGKNLNDGPCSCGASDDREDPWSALDGLDLPER